jgi:SAM-dependent methyltransferase
MNEEGITGTTEASRISALPIDAALASYEQLFNEASTRLQEDRQNRHAAVGQVVLGCLWLETTCDRYVDELLRRRVEPRLAEVLRTALDRRSVPERLGILAAVASPKALDEYDAVLEGAKTVFSLRKRLVDDRDALATIDSIADRIRATKDWMDVVYLESVNPSPEVVAPCGQPAAPSIPPRPTSLAKALPKKFRLTPRPEPIALPWPEPPIDPEQSMGKVVRSIYEPGDAADRYDIHLFEQLNNEYKSKPVNGQPQQFQGRSMTEAAGRHVSWAHGMIDLRHKRVLEIGCGSGLEVWLMANHLDADAYGVDVVERASWAALRGPHAHLECRDLTQDNPYPDGLFDRVVSFTVWEHVVHPYTLLRETFRVMKPGALFFLRANLYRGALASHRYREVYFPWPHLLFSDEVFREYYRRIGKPARRAAWVNKLTWTQYERYIEMAGFDVKSVGFTERPLDEEFYERFKDALGRYPRWDLTKEFFTAVLQKPE